MAEQEHRAFIDSWHVLASYIIAAVNLQRPSDVHQTLKAIELVESNGVWWADNPTAETSKGLFQFVEGSSNFRQNWVPIMERRLAGESVGLIDAYTSISWQFVEMIHEHTNGPKRPGFTTLENMATTHHLGPGHPDKDGPYIDKVQAKKRPRTLLMDIAPIGVGVGFLSRLLGR